MSKGWVMKRPVALLPLATLIIFGALVMIRLFTIVADAKETEPAIEDSTDVSPVIDIPPVIDADVSRNASGDVVLIEINTAVNATTEEDIDTDNDDIVIESHKLDRFANLLKNIGKTDFTKAKSPPSGRFFYQMTSKRGIGNTVAEYNFGVLISIMHNLTRIHTPLRCARTEEGECESIFRLSGLNRWSMESIEAEISSGNIKEVKISKKKPLRETIDKEVENFKDANALFRLDQPAASYSYKYTRNFWSMAYALARKTHPMSCEYSKEPHKLHVAVHVRHGDVLRYAQKGWSRLTKLRYLPLDYFKNLISKLLEYFHEDQIRLHLFTDGNIEDLKPLLDAYSFASFINTDPIRSLHLLAASDILISSKSGFSQLAAVIGSGGGGNIKIIPDAEWPSYDGIPNTITMDESLLNNQTALFDKLDTSITQMMQPGHFSEDGWYCPKRSCGAVRQALLSAIKSQELVSQFESLNVSDCHSKQ
ncbi:hypothetical protein BC829DRAFT_382023 [Chytridium lagenaria]|nr:hypothetical protein BC829DRAFT_382023 [Chytridium lagenaria]